MCYLSFIISLHSHMLLLSFFSSTIFLNHTKIESIVSSLPTYPPEKNSVVVETEWSEARKQLYRNQDVWLVGSAATTEIVLIVKRSRLAGKKVEGDIKAWGHGTPENLCLIQKEPSLLSHSVLNMSRLILSDRSFFLSHQPAWRLHSPSSCRIVFCSIKKSLDPTPSSS